MTDTYEYNVWERLLSLDLQTAVNQGDRGTYDYSYESRARQTWSKDLLAPASTG